MTSIVKILTDRLPAVRKKYKQFVNVWIQGWVFSVYNLFFPGQNGINWDKPVFPVQNWEKLPKTGKNYAGLYFKPEKSFQKMLFIK